MKRFIPIIVILLLGTSLVYAGDFEDGDVAGKS